MDYICPECSFATNDETTFVTHLSVFPCPHTKHSRKAVLTPVQYTNVNAAASKVGTSTFTFTPSYIYLSIVLGKSRELLYKLGRTDNLSTCTKKGSQLIMGVLCDPSITPIDPLYRKFNEDFKAKGLYRLYKGDIEQMMDTVYTYIGNSALVTVTKQWEKEERDRFVHLDQFLASHIEKKENSFIDVRSISSRLNASTPCLL